MVELQLLQRQERTVALLRQRQPPLLGSVRPQQEVVARGGLAQERRRDEDGAANGQDRTDEQRDAHIRTATPS